MSLIIPIEVNMNMEQQEFLKHLLSLGRVRKYIKWNGVVCKLNFHDDVKE